MPESTDAAKVYVELSVEELQATTRFLEDQIFRVRFIDPKIPGNRANHEQLTAAQSALEALTESLKNRSVVKKRVRVSDATVPQSIDTPSFQRPIKRAAPSR